MGAEVYTSAMNHGRRRVLVCVWLLCSLVSPLCLGQPVPLNDWQRVRGLSPGSAIVVETMAGTRYHGEFVTATADSIALDSDERGFPGRAIRRRDVPRGEVRQVRRLRRGASALAGAGIGAAAGAGIGLAIDLSARSNEDRGLATAVFTLLGALLGWAVGRHTTVVKGERIYVAP